MASSKYQYGTSPRKVDPVRKTAKTGRKKQPKLKVVKELPREKIKISDKQKKKQSKTIMFSVMFFLVLFAISYQNSQISVKFNELQGQKKELSVLQKENEQLKINIENNLNMGNIEKEAKEQLGMEKLTNKQTVYVTLPKKDYVQPANEKIVKEEKKSLIEKIQEWIFHK